MNMRRGYKQTRQLTHDQMKECGEFFISMRESIGFSRLRMSKELHIDHCTLRRWGNAEVIPQIDISELVEWVRDVVRKYKR